MRTRAGTVVLATSLGLGGLVTGVVLAPAMATAASSEVTATAAVGDRLTHLKDALKGLVSDGTLTQAQADKVATTLDSTLPQRGGPEGPGRGHGRGHGAKLRGAGLEAAATAIGITKDELKTELRAGKTLAQVAESKGVSKATLVDKLVAAAQAALAQAVTDGKLTQAQADERSAGLEARITEQVDKVRPAGGPRGPRGPRGSGDSGDEAPPPADSDESSPSAESSSTT